MPAHKRQFCPRGHDTHVVGRYSGGRCKACPKNETTKVWTEARKKEAIAYKGYACIDCGFVFGARTECADFDHREGRQNATPRGYPAHRYAKEKRERELDKCDLVCANCHRTRTRHRPPMRYGV